MNLDRQTLNLAAAVLCGIGSLAALVDGVASGGLRGASSRAAVVSGLFGTIGSAAWAMSAYQDLEAARAEADLG